MTEISYREMVEMMIGMNRHIALLEECILEISDNVDFTIKETIKARLDSCKMPQAKHYRFVHEVREQLDAHDMQLAVLTRKRDNNTSYIYSSILEEDDVAETTLESDKSVPEKPAT